MTQKIIATLLCIATIHGYAMEQARSIALRPLLHDNVKKIMACCDLQSQKTLRLTCHDILQIKTEDLIHHSPLILSKYDHKFYMVHAARTDNELLMKNLINNATLCNHEDALDLMVIFVPKKTDDLLDNLIITSLKKGNRQAENAFKYDTAIKTAINQYRYEIFHTIHTFFPQLMKLYKTDKAMMNYYICTLYNIKNPDNIAQEKVTPLQVAACEGNIAMTELLLLNGHEEHVNDADLKGYTPLYIAEDIDIVKLLLNCKNIQVNKKTNDHLTPLYKAVCKNKTLLIKLFLAHPGCIINEEDENQLTPLHTAARRGEEQVFNFFLRHTEGKVRSMTKPIHYAAVNGHVDIIATILRVDISQLNIQNQVGETPLLLASTFNQYGAIKFLLDLEALVDLADHNNITPLWIASQNGCNEAALLLINGKAPVNALSKDKVTPLWKAAQNGKTQIVQWLLENHATVDHADDAGITSLMIASKKGYTAIVKMLLGFGANPALKTKYGITAVDIAGNDQIKKLLEKQIDLKLK